MLLGFSAGSYTADQYLFAYPDSAHTVSSTASSSPGNSSSSVNVGKDDNNNNNDDDDQLSNTDVAAAGSDGPQYSHVAGAILMSNVASLSDDDAGFYNPAEWARVAANAGCRRNATTAAADAAELACMRRVDARALRQAIYTTGDTRVIVGPATPRGGQPRPDNITFFTPAALRQRVAEGKYARVVEFVFFLSFSLYAFLTAVLSAFTLLFPSSSLLWLLVLPPGLVSVPTNIDSSSLVYSAHSFFLAWSNFSISLAAAIMLVAKEADNRLGY